MEKPIRTCPECNSGEYQFRGRKNVPAENDKPAATITKYRCKKCSHVWAVHVEVTPT